MPERTIANYHVLLDQPFRINEDGTTINLGFKPTSDAYLPTSGRSKPVITFRADTRRGAQFGLNVNPPGQSGPTRIMTRTMTAGETHTFFEAVSGDHFRGTNGVDNVTFERLGGDVVISDVIVWFNRKIRV